LWESEPLKSKTKPTYGIYSSVDYLSALRDGRFKEIAKAIKEKTVAIIGGGSVAMDCAESAAKLGAKDVYLVYRRSYAQMPAEDGERVEVQKAGVHFLLLNQPVDYVCDKRNRLKGVKMIRTRLGDSDSSGRRSPKPVRGSEWMLGCDVVIEAVGNRAATGSHRWYPNVKVNEHKLIQTKPKTLQTSVKGIFAGGDIVRGPALVVLAVQDGKTAARAILKFLNK
jgi:NADPH-dependent glutamate synthase beta subunit-like oxidoreductase